MIDNISILYNSLKILYYIILIITTVYAIVRFNKVDLASKIICLFIWNGFITELLAWLAAIKIKNNLWVYNASSLLEFIIICIYFNFAIPSFKKNKLGFYMAAAGLIVFGVNAIYFQPFYKVNSNFLFLECLSIICLSLYLTFRMVIDLDILPGRELHFWFSTILLFYQSAGLWVWALYDYIQALSNNETLFLHCNLVIVALITYASFFIILYRYPHLKKSIYV
jgi:hypothetical protein